MPAGHNATMIASSSIPSTVEWASLGPVGKSLTAVRFFHLATVSRSHDPPDHGLRSTLVDPVTLGESPQALLTMLYRSTGSRRVALSRAGAPV
jgi:hypothetical protein